MNLKDEIRLIEETFLDQLYVRGFIDRDDYNKIMNEFFGKQEKEDADE